MRTRDLFFSFRGRIPRQLWWLGACTHLVALSAVTMIFIAVLTFTVAITGQAEKGVPLVHLWMTTVSLPIPSPYDTPIQALWVTCYILGMLPLFALIAKRLRDAEGSVLRLLVLVVPLVLALVLPRIIDPPQATRGGVIGASVICWLLLYVPLGFKQSRADQPAD